jgi:hypothetical protein
VSVGGTLAAAEDTKETLIKRAYRLMRRSKKEGKNCVTVECISKDDKEEPEPEEQEEKKEDDKAGEKEEEQKKQEENPETNQKNEKATGK